ncbi:hypothetical protein IWQ60_000952 [Tieghemiomyces parasiticus]|uniref:Fungal lipase-type domain-containing protein n=1 Tax=Tieghemiomyces parasiticus TaxID=78921 RepID=A0A9W8AF30_9FUNG|nr:hypothetical protein IWQ60_000952 [Tieghemiomyces parasiticus]
MYHYADRPDMGLAAYLAYRLTDQRTAEVILSFRGSSDPHTWLYDLQFASLNYTYDPVRGAKVHGGFYRCFQAIQPEIHQQLTSLIADLTLNPDEPVETIQMVVTGHSLGGALATLASLDIVQRIDELVPTNPSGRTRRNGVNIEIDLTLTTIGGPRVGNRAFAELIYETVLKYTTTTAVVPAAQSSNNPLGSGGDSLLSDYRGQIAAAPQVVVFLDPTTATGRTLRSFQVNRLTSNNDLIPTLPPTLLGFYHHPHEYWVTLGLSRHATQVMECPDVKVPNKPTSIRENPFCSKAQPSPNMGAHMYVWDISFGPWCL